MAAALCGALVLLGQPPPPPQLPAAEERERAGEVLRARLDQVDQRRALHQEDRNEVGNLAALQTQAAELSLLEMSWVTLPRQGVAVPVELRLRVLGPPERLPVLVEGLHRQSRPAELRRMRIRSTGSEVVAELELRFHRPPELDEEALSEAWEQQQGEAEALELLMTAGELELLEGFEAALPELSKRSAEARKAMMQHLPLALSVLDEHEAVTLSWDGELHTEPPLIGDLD